MLVVRAEQMNVFTALIHEGIAEVRKYRFATIREGTLAVVLRCAFGHACTDALLYPWSA